MVPRLHRMLPIMPRPLDLPPSPSAAVSTALVAVDRAVAELRRGAMGAVRAGNDITLALAAEAVTDDALTALARITTAQPALAVTGRRAAVLGLRSSDSAVAVVALSAPDGLFADDIAGLADPGGGIAGLRDPASLAVTDLAPGSGAAAAVALTKLARLLPAAVFASAKDAAGLPEVQAADILDYQHAAARSLRMVSEARVPLKDAENARVIAFRPGDGGIEHLAIVIGEPDSAQAVLTRLHSECFTGDLLGSLRCDCGDQLRGAITEISAAGSGILLYLAQEGRGIGLVNKLRAYQLQDGGFDTLDANLQLGFDDDERIYQPAAQMLRLLGVSRVRLLTNNPNKVAALAQHGIEVAERVPHVFPTNDHNALYLHTKASRGGHLF